MKAAYYIMHIIYVACILFTYLKNTNELAIFDGSLVWEWTINAILLGFGNKLPVTDFDLGLLKPSS